MKDNKYIQIPTFDIKSLVEYLREKDDIIHHLEYVNRGITNNHRKIRDLLIQSQDKPVKYILDILLSMLDEF